MKVDPDGEPGGGGGAPIPPETCDPTTDPNCYVPLNAQDTILFINALATLRPASEFTDSSAAAACLELYTKFNEMLFSGRVFKGRPENADGHDGYYFRDTIHLGLSLHEAAHALKDAAGAPKYSHGRFDTPGSYPFPFKHTSPASISEANACAKFP